MKRASFLLETARLDREYTLDEISKKTKIPLRYLKAFESESTRDFPDEPYCSLMLREYATFLGLKSDDIISIFRRDFNKKIDNKNTKNHLFSFTPQFTYTIAIVSLIILFAIYLLSEYVKFNRPPNLVVEFPTSYSKIVEIKGVTDIESTVKINDSLVVVDQYGKFIKKIELSATEAKIVVKSTSPSGKTTGREIILK
ncbi:MAG: helix-turn-helix domain-containing protein [Candidatus Shapirobacteria bacterium]